MADIEDSIEPKSNKYKIVFITRTNFWYMYGYYDKYKPTQETLNDNPDSFVFGSRVEVTWLCGTLLSNWTKNWERQATHAAIQEASRASQHDPLPNPESAVYTVWSATFIGLVGYNMKAENITKSEIQLTDLDLEDVSFTNTKFLRLRKQEVLDVSFVEAIPKTILSEYGDDNIGINNTYVFPDTALTTEDRVAISNSASILIEDGGWDLMGVTYGGTLLLPSTNQKVVFSLRDVYSFEFLCDISEKELGKVWQEDENEDTIEDTIIVETNEEMKSKNSNPEFKNRLYVSKEFFKQDFEYALNKILYNDSRCITWDDFMNACDDVWENGI